MKRYSAKKVIIATAWLFKLSEIKSIHSPLGLPFKRDMFRQLRMLEEIAPELSGK